MAKIYVKAVKHDENYTIINLMCAKDKGLSLQAKGLHLILYAYGSIPNWELNHEHLIGLSTNGATSLKSAIKELKDRNYLKIYPIHNKGHIKSWQWDIYETLYVQNKHIQNKHIHDKGGSKKEKEVRKEKEVINKENSNLESIKSFQERSMEKILMPVIKEFSRPYDPEKDGRDFTPSTPQELKKVIKLNYRNLRSGKDRVFWDSNWLTYISFNKIAQKEGIKIY